jgi:CBS domain-containing protein
VGTITQEEAAVRVPSARRRLGPMRVADVIGPDILFCFENTEVNEAAKLMKENRVSFLPVLSRSKKVVGVLALKDIPGERVATKTA